MIKVGIIGVGGTVSIADMHVEALKQDQDFIITKVYNRTFEKANAFIKKHQLKAINAPSLDEFFQDIDAVIITTSNDVHDAYVRLACQHHKHILIEKPLTGDCAQSLKLYQDFAEYSKVIMVGYLNRYAPMIQDLKSILHQHFYEVYTIQASYGGKRIANPEVPFEWRMSQACTRYGASMDFGSHLVDLIGYILEKPLELVHRSDTIGITKRKIKDVWADVENDDAAVLTLKANQTLISCIVSRIGMDSIRLMISGDGGIITLSFNPPMHMIYEEKLTLAGFTGKTVEKTYSETQKNLMMYQLSVFKDAIQNKNVNYPNLFQGMIVDCTIDS